MKISKPIQYVIAVGGLLILGLLGWNAYSAYQENNAVTSEPSPIAPKPPKPKLKASPTPVAKASAPSTQASPTQAAKASAPALKASPTQATKASAPAAQTTNPATAFYNAVNKATNAAELTQTAETKAEWNTVATNWQQAIALMKIVPRTNRNSKVAQQKVVEYQKNLQYAQQASANAK